MAVDVKRPLFVGFSPAVRGWALGAANSFRSWLRLSQKVAANNVSGKRSASPAAQRVTSAAVAADGGAGVARPSR